jgi:tetratricopeptide (TPR) repeat protein
MRALFIAGIIFAALVPQSPAQAIGEADAIYRDGTRLLADGKYPEAEAAFRKTSALEPDKARGMAGVAEIYLRQKKENEAIRLMQELSDRHAGQPDFRIALANTLVGAQRFDDGVAQFQRVLANLDQGSNTAADLYVAISAALYKKGDVKAAIDQLEQARQFVPTSRPVVINLAVMLDGAGQKGRARVVYQDALTLDPANPIVLNNLAYLLAENTSDFDRALFYAEQARKARPDSREILDTLAYVYMKQNRNDEAIALYRDLVKSATGPLQAALSQSGPPLWSLHMNLATALDQKGERKTAIAELKAALDGHPSNAAEKNIRAMLEKWSE